MAFQWTPYHPLLLVSVALSGVVAVLAWGRREQPGSTPLTVFALAVGCWSVAQFLSLASSTVGGMLFWSSVEVVCSTVVAASWALVALEYSGRDSLVNRRTLPLFAVEPALVVASLLFAPRTVFQQFGREQVVGGYFLPDEVLGPVLLAHFVYSFTLVLVTAGLVVLSGIRERDLTWQAVVVGLAVVPLLVANLAWVLDLTPQGMNPTNLAFVVSAVLLLVGIDRHRVLEVMPAVRTVARRQLFVDLPDAVVAVNTTGAVVDLNTAAENVFQVDRDVVVGSQFDATFPELAGDSVSELVRTVDGQQRYFDVRSATLGTATDPRGQLVTLRDVTDRRQTEEWYRTLLERALDIITVIDESGTITYASPSVEPVLGYDATELVGEQAFEYIHPSDRDDVQSVVANALDEPDTEDGAEFRFRDANGNWRWLEARGRNLLDDPLVEGFVVDSREITDRKQRQQLVDVMRRLLRHNLRNDMTLVEGYAEEIATNTTSATHRQYAETIADLAETTVDRSDTLNRIIDDVDATDHSLVDFSTVVQHGVDHLRTVHPDVDIDLTIEQPLFVRGGPSLRLVVEELVQNAAEHGTETDESDTSTPDGVPDAGGTAAVTVRLYSDGRDAVLTVADDGPGIPRAELEPLLLQNETPLEHTSGLGLWVASWVVHRFEGTIEFENDDGTTVVVRLPAKRRDVSQNDSDDSQNDSG
ncbi:histidine kinase N-terminal 7TM domain-containing protein [Haloarchaeobius sp. TZWWS8]|uniref:histidine kinase N-terminal 7TM domain-containing protein n=1 Tax=Haloarchaeobius sp. TZWWS8 TaxID=3446121 RepID=UPI003EB6CD57